jgi:hypothetical protein
MYGRRLRRESKVFRRVEASDRFSSRWWTDTACDLRRGVSVRNFLESVDIRLFDCQSQFRKFAIANLHFASGILLDRQMVVEHFGHKLKSSDKELVIY